MKKLNITKEQFNKSRYFQKKYGKLEYVSESGNMYKTDKGKVLMFKEGIFSDIGDSIDDGISNVRKFFHGKPKFKEGDVVMLCEIEWSPCGVTHGGIVTRTKWDDNKWYYELDFGGDSDIDWWPEDALVIDPDPEGGFERLQPKELTEKYPEFVKRAKTILGKKTCQKLGIDESTKKFGKKFKESKRPEWLNTFKKAQDFVDKACEHLEVVAFEGGAEVGNPIHEKLLNIWGEMRDVIESV